MRAMLVVLCASAWLVGCTATQPVVVIGTNGQVMRGTATAGRSGDSFTVTDGKLTCGGSSNSMSLEPKITMQALCSDGRRGIVTATRDSSGQSVIGTLRMEDGTSGQYIFGPVAAHF